MDRCVVMSELWGTKSNKRQTFQADVQGTREAEIQCSFYLSWLFDVGVYRIVLRYLQKINMKLRLCVMTVLSAYYR